MWFPGQSEDIQYPRFCKRINVITYHRNIKIIPKRKVLTRRYHVASSLLQVPLVPLTPVCTPFHRRTKMTTDQSAPWSYRREECYIPTSPPFLNGPRGHLKVILYSKRMLASTASQVPFPNKALIIINKNTLTVRYANSKRQHSCKRFHPVHSPLTCQ